MSNDSSSSVEDILSASLNDAFSSVPAPDHIVRVPAEPEHISSQSETAAVAPEPSSADVSTSSSAEIDEFKAEYDAQVAKWKAQSAEAREKADKERARWEAIRAEERRNSQIQGPEDIPGPGHHEAGWETVSSAASHTDATPSVADARDLVTGESESKPSTSSAETEVTPPPAHSQTSTADGDSQKWEDIPASLTSSYPSMSYPEHIDSPPTHHHHPAPVQQAPPLNATVAIFDSSLSTRTRVKALFSSLAINMLLPFVNGVMLGFGEIFAKNVVMGWFGWRITPVASSTGIGASARVPKEYRTVQKAS